MFDYNPFRDFKEMMKKKILSEVVDGRQKDIRQASDEINRAERIAGAQPFTGGLDPEGSPDGVGDDPSLGFRNHHTKMKAIVSNPESSVEDLSKVTEGLHHTGYYRDDEKKKEIQDALRNHPNYNPEVHSKPISLRQLSPETIQHMERTRRENQKLLASLNRYGGR